MLPDDVAGAITFVVKLIMSFCYDSTVYSHKAYTNTTRSGLNASCTRQKLHCLSLFWCFVKSS